MRNRKVVAVDKLTGAVVGSYSSIKEAAAAFGMNETDVCQECRKRKVPNSRFEMLRYEDDDSPIDWHGNRCRAIVATDGRTVHAWPSFTSAAKCSSLTNYALRKRIVRGTPIELLGTKMIARFVESPVNRGVSIVRHVLGREKEA